MTESWRTTDAPPELNANDIHVWCLDLTCDESQLAWHRSLLANDEQRRADKFLFDRHRRRFTVGRSRLRQILAAYLGSDATDIEFEYTGLGKPRLRGHETGTGLCFNFSNSHERALAAITRDVEIGVDIERVRSMESLEGLAERFFAEIEKDFILQQAEPSRTTSFFHCWTRKEAFLKAIGKGLTFPLRDVTVELQPSETVRIVEINDDQQNAADWTLEHLAVEPEYVGALACCRGNNRISYLRID